MLLSYRSALTLLLAAAAHGACADAPSFTLEEIAPGVHLHRGQHADLDSPARADSANLAYIEGDRCLAVIDSGGAVATGVAFRDAIRARTAKPVCYVVNTHVHFDHVLGNAAFVGPDTRIVGHHNLVEAMGANRDFFAESFAAELGGKDHGDRVIGPDVMVEATLQLDLGGRVLSVVAEPLAHTATDVSVLDLRTQTLFTGDLVFRERLPVLDGSLKGWMTWMDGAMQAHYALVVPGHGPPDRAWPAGAVAQRAYFQALFDATRAALERGDLMEDTEGRLAAEALAGWQLTDRAHRVNVSRAYRELEWD